LTQQDAFLEEKHNSGNYLRIFCIFEPSYHGISHPVNARGGNDFQICKVIANILNKQSRTADKGMFVVQLTTPCSE
jgi:hypothetical protein